MPAPLILVSHVPTSETSYVHPRFDYLELAAEIQGELSFPANAVNPVGSWERRAAFDLRQAIRALRRTDVSMFISLSEKIGFPLELLRRKRHRTVPHLLVAHRLTTFPKKMLYRATGILNRFDRIIVLSRAQEAYLKRIGVRDEVIHCLYDKVDHRFWHPTHTAEEIVGAKYILAVGQEQRDYRTLLQAVMPLNRTVLLVIITSGLWNEGRTRSRWDSRFPSNVLTFSGIAYEELYRLYNNAALVVLPLRKGTDFAAGSNAALEAMAMRRPLVITRTPGLAEYLSEDTAWMVPAGDSDALRAAIESILKQPETARDRVNRARQIIDNGPNLDIYVREIARIVREVSAK